MTYYDQPLAGEGVSAVTATPSEALGTYRNVDGVTYVYAYNAGSVAVWPGDSVHLVAGSESYSFTATNAASHVGIFAGGVQHATISTNYYGWIATKGLCRVRPDTSAVSFDTGDWLVVGVDNGYSTAGATFSTAARIGMCVTSCVTNLGASAADCGTAWIRSDVW